MAIGAIRLASYLGLITCFKSYEKGTRSGCRSKSASSRPAYFTLFVQHISPYVLITLKV